MQRFGVAVMVAALSVGTVYAQAAKAKAPMAGKSVLWAAEDLKWAPVPDFPVTTAVLWGDPAKGAHGAFLKLPGGFEAPMHHHTSDHKVVVLSGRVTLAPEGEAAKTLGTGSYFSFAGKKKHTTKCEGTAECLLFIDSAGAWDVLVADAMAAPKK